MFIVSVYRLILSIPSGSGSGSGCGSEKYETAN